MISSASGNSQVFWSHFVRFCWTLKKVISLVFQLRKTESSSTIDHTAFWRYLLHLFELSSSYTLSVLLKMCERLSTSVSHVLPLFFCFCFFSCFSSILFSSTCLNHLAPYRSYVPNRWLKFLFFKGGGASYVLRCLIGWKLWLQALAVTLRQQSNFSAWHSLCGDNTPPYQI